MCLILFAHRAHARYPLILAANRDEWFDRPTAPAGFWDARPDLLAGRDLEQNGTWLGVTRAGRFAGITNFRAPSGVLPNAPSRGQIVRDYLEGDGSPEEFAAALAASAAQYNGYNFLGGTIDRLMYFSNRLDAPQAVTPGVHGLSNHLLDTDWPKVETGKVRIEALRAAGAIELAQLFDVLADREPAADSALPATGVPLGWERALSAAHIQPYSRAQADGTERHYGTRCATVLLIDASGTVEFAERSFDIDGAVTTIVREGFRAAVPR